MKRLPRRTRLTLTFLAIAYCGGYLFLRGNGDITHFDCRGFGAGHEVYAPASAWDGLAAQMLIHAPGRRPPHQNLAYHLVGRWVQVRPGVYNLVFFPLRKAEELWWYLADRP